MSFLSTYNQKYAPFMGGRKHTFAQILKYLEQKGAFDDEIGFQIVETGCTRNPDVKIAMSGDGASSVLWDDFLSYHKGHLHSVDINPVFVDTCKKLVSPERCTVTCSDSVSHLLDLCNNQWKADLVYLDSYDLDWNNPHPSSLHHMKELVAIRPLLRSGTLIVVDDHRHPVGKGMYIYDFFDHLHLKPLFMDYQVGWVWP